MPSPVGLAHVCAVSFLAARIAPTGAFWLSLAGGAALARESDLRGMRSGYASSVAAMLETVALVGPLRFNAPLTQAMSAPLMGAMHARGRRPVAQFAACLAIRIAHYTVLTAFALFVLLGPKAYAGGYHTLFSWLPLLPTGLAGALILTAITNGVAAIVFSVIQTAFYRHALAGWSQRSLAPRPTPGQPMPAVAPAPAEDGRTDPRVALVVATFLTVVLLVSHQWVVLGAVALWLTAAVFLARHGDREVLQVGLVLALTLAIGTLIAALIGGLGLSDAASRAVRAALLVMVPTWMRMAAGSAGLREAFRRMLLRFRRVPGAIEASDVLAELDSGPLLLGSARALRDRLGAVSHRVAPIVDAVLSWAAHEAGSLPEIEREGLARLRIRRHDALLALSVLLPAGALAAIAMPV